MPTRPRRSPTGTVLLYTRETEHNRAAYPVVWAERIRRTSLSTWERRVVYGAPAADAEEFISSWVQDDYSAGVGIEDGNEGVDTGKISFGVIDLRSPKQVVLPPKTLTPTNPSWATGAAMPLGDVVTGIGSNDDRYYQAWGSHAAGWDEGGLTWKVTDNNLAKTPVDVGVQYGGWLFVPCGATGAIALRQSSDATGTLNIQPIALNVLGFCEWTMNLYAVTTDNRLWQMSPIDLENLGPTVVSTTTTGGWCKVGLESLPGEVIINRSMTPTKLVVFSDKSGDEKLWCITNKNAYILEWTGPSWIKAPIDPSMHPDWGRGAVTWRSGETLHITGGGLDMTDFTPSQVTTPTAGPGPQIPADFRGTIVDLKGERSTLYALVRGLPPVTQSSFEDVTSPGGEVHTLLAPTVALWLGAYTGTAWCCLHEDRITTAEPTKLHVSTAKNSYRLWFGATDGQPRSQLIPLDFYQPRAKHVLGRDPYAKSGWWETIRYDAMMTGWDKLGSHVFVNTDWATSTEYIDVYYRTNLNYYDDQDPHRTQPLFNPPWTLWKRVDHAGRTLMWFDDNPDEINHRTGTTWREGLPFQWIQFRYYAERGDNEYISPIWQSQSMHHIRIPQDAASFVIKIPFFEGVGGRGQRGRSGREMALSIRDLQRGQRMVQLQPNNYENFRGRIVGISEEAWVGGENFSTVLVLNFVEVGASSSIGQVVA